MRIVLVRCCEVKDETKGLRAETIFFGVGLRKLVAAVQPGGQLAIVTLPSSLDTIRPRYLDTARESPMPEESHSCCDVVMAYHGSRLIMGTAFSIERGETSERKS